MLPLLGLAEAVAFALDDHELGAVEQAVDERHDACGVGEDRRPLCKGLVGREHDRLVLLVPTGDDLEEQVSVPGVVGEIADFIEPFRKMWDERFNKLESVMKKYKTKKYIQN